MPLLWGEQMLGWANLKVVKGQLKHELGFVSSRPRGSAFQRALDEALQQMRVSNGKGGVIVAGIELSESTGSIPLFKLKLKDRSLLHPTTTRLPQRVFMCTIGLSIEYPAGTWNRLGSGSLRWIFVSE